MTDKNSPLEISEFYDGLLEKVRAIRLQAQNRLADIKKEQGQLAGELRAKLARGESLRKRDFDRMLTSLVEARKHRQQEVAELLARFQTEEEEMAAGLRRLLGDGKRVRIKDLKKFLVEFKTKQADRDEDIFQVKKQADSIKNQAQLLIDQFRQDREEMAKQWRQLGLTMRQKRDSRPATKG